MQPSTQFDAAGSPFHEGEQAVQEKVGVREMIEPWARQVVRSYLPNQHREFYANLPFVVAAARDSDGRPWATLLTGPIGFVESPEATQLQFATNLLSGDALQGSLSEGVELGLLGIDLETRRRNRVNGKLSGVGLDNIRFVVDQSFGNCPQYITERSWTEVPVSAADTSVLRAGKLTQEMRAWIEAADTLFIASGYHRENTEGSAYGMDASHRGGAAGFVKVLSDTKLVFPDYAGNNHFNTIGNLVVDSRVGLSFVDFENGSLLQITGKASIDWDSEEVRKHAGALRLVNIEIESIVRLAGVLPLRWSEPRGSIRSLRLTSKVQESDDVVSFEFAARDGGDLADFDAGQHLPIECRIGGHDQPLQRTYSLSSGPREGRYRISVKRESQGIVSQYLHDNLKIGDILSSKKPNGDFVLEQGTRPVVLISAGIGVTPMVSMLRTLTRDAGNRPVYFVHGVRDGSHHPLATEVRGIAEQNANVQLLTAYSQPHETDVQGVDYDERGRVTGEMVDAFLPDHDADFYLCGPAPFLANINNALQKLGVKSERIRAETF